MGCEKLSHQLLDLGLFCALGTTETFSGRDTFVKRGTPMTWDSNNGTAVVYDERGLPWICLNNKEFWAALDEKFKLTRGAFVPHSNDGGNFIRKIFGNVEVGLIGSRP